MHDREIVLIAVVVGLVWLTLACARAASRADQVVELEVVEQPLAEWEHVALWEDELQPQRPIYDWEAEGI